MSASVQMVADGWKPAVIAPYDKVLMARFLRDGEVIEREMVRLRERLWWDLPYRQYAHEEPREFREATNGNFKWP